jgi:hypothetical protein
MPEAKELRWVDTTRKLGDVVLMRVPEKKFQQLHARDRRIREHQQTSVVSQLEEMGERYRGRGVIVHTNPDSRMLDRMAQRAAAQQIAGKKFDQMLKTGTVPGAELGR